MEWTSYPLLAVFCLFGLLVVVRLYFKWMGKPISNYDLNLKLERALQHIHQLRMDMARVSLSMRGTEIECEEINKRLDEIVSSISEAESVVICKTPEPELIG